MASGFFALLDDIASLMDDVVVMSKISTKKTAAILGDDLAVNAEKATGFVSSRELPVLWAISKGSLKNKLIILPLAYEAAEKIYEYFFPHKETKKIVAENLSKEAQLLLEKEKIRSAIITDFILSIEIVIIALGTVLEESLLFQILVVSVVALIATVGVYGIVALIVRMDDLGLKLIELSKDSKGVLNFTGNFLIRALPKLVKGLSLIGTLALILVSGGIFSHNVSILHHVLELRLFIFQATH